jgi:esterase/lipase superfamily enzyme
VAFLVLLAAVGILSLILSDHPLVRPDDPAVITEETTPSYEDLIKALEQATTDEERDRILSELPPTGASPVPTPPFEPVIVEEMAAAEGTEDYWVQKVLFGTDRNVETTDVVGPKFGHDRARRLALGMVEVTIPKNAHERGQVERPGMIKIPLVDIVIWRGKEDVEKHFTVLGSRLLSPENFSAMAADIAFSSERYRNTAFVYIHGFNTSFDAAMFRAAQLAHDLDFDGPAFAYSWPSVGALADYTTDMDSAEIAVKYLDEFLDIVFQTEGVEKVHLLAHSMGNAALAELLTRSGTKLSDRGKAIDQMVLAAPDLDAQKFEEIAEHFTKAAQGVTLYASGTDRALLLSQSLRSGHIRLGDVGPGGPVVVDGMDSIDITSVGTELFSTNHNTYASYPALVDDLGKLFLSGQRPPTARAPEIMKVSGQSGVYWRLSD